jgi:hypothetical protein
LNGFMRLSVPTAAGLAKALVGVVVAWKFMGVRGGRCEGAPEPIRLFPFCPHVSGPYRFRDRLFR